jgi:hypothetical protein
MSHEFKPTPSSFATTPFNQASSGPSPMRGTPTGYASPIVSSPYYSPGGSLTPVTLNLLLCFLIWK